MATRKKVGIGMAPLMPGLISVPFNKRGMVFAHIDCPLANDKK
jgi:hypothetical protein